MNPPIQLISTDFDGTLFAEFESPPVPAGLQQLIRSLQARGTRWVINTGRDMSNLMESLCRARLSIQPDYLVLVEREIHVRDGTRYVGLQEWNQSCQMAHRTLFERIRPDVSRLTAWVNERFDAMVYEDPFSPFCLIAGNRDDADLIVAHLEAYCEGHPCLTVVRNDVYARFSHSGFSKGTALAEIARRLNVPSERVLAAGDHYNDLPMLSRAHAALLVAPANAIPAVREHVLSQEGFVSDEPCGYGVLAGLEHYLKLAQYQVMDSEATP
jgi:hydroxymethylpyrimidine pyrophosphatase-like HAD family hydrolase